MLEKQLLFFGNGFSPFSRKVGLALEYKGLEYRYVDGLARENHAALQAMNARGEVPAIKHNGLVVTQSAHIVSYLDEAFPDRPILPKSAECRVIARRLEQLFGTIVDAAIVNSSLWTWANRPDRRPNGLFEAAQSDIFDALLEVEGHLGEDPDQYMFGGEPGIVEFTLWPHVTALKPLGFEIDQKRLPKLTMWIEKMRRTPLFRNDTKQTGRFLKEMSDETHERTKIAWRGDRLEWILSRGFHDWFFQEVQENRVIWPT